MLLVNRFMNIALAVVLGQHDLVLQGVVLALFCYTLGLVHFSFEYFGLKV